MILPYYELNIGESLTHTLKNGKQVTIRLDGIAERTLSVTVNSTLVTIALGHFAPTVVAQAPGDVVNIVEVEGIKIGADVTKVFMSGTNYSLTQINLHKDARLYINDAGERLSPPGTYRFPIADYAWNFADNWLNKVPYGWHLGIDPNAEMGQPLVAVTDGTVIAIRHYRPLPDESEDFWGNNLALLGNDGVLYLYMHWDHLAPAIDVGSVVKAGDALGAVGRSGFETKPFPTHLHFEMMLLKHPENFYFSYEMEPGELPKRYLPAEVEGFVINPYPYLVEWHLAET
jgi:murein DD-endopeptidase MepM/ murein hydrolase activator NlpD